MPLLRRTHVNRLWSPEQRSALRVRLRRLTRLSPYLIVLALPGSFLTLPALAWWLNRRRMSQHTRTQPPLK